MHYALTYLTAKWLAMKGEVSGKRAVRPASLSLPGVEESEYVVQQCCMLRLGVACLRHILAAKAAGDHQAKYQVTWGHTQVQTVDRRIWISLLEPSGECEFCNGGELRLYAQR